MKRNENVGQQNLSQQMLYYIIAAPAPGQGQSLTDIPNPIQDEDTLTLGAQPAKCDLRPPSLSFVPSQLSAQVRTQLILSLSHSFWFAYER